MKTYLLKPQLIISAGTLRRMFGFQDVQPQKKLFWNVSVFFFLYSIRSLPNFRARAKGCGRDLVDEFFIEFFEGRYRMSFAHLLYPILNLSCAIHRVLFKIMSVRSFLLHVLIGVYFKN